MTPALVGGFFLIIGAYFTFKGNIFYAVGTYFLADIAWCTLALISGDIPGLIMTIIGMILGLLAFLKMQSGEFSKKISKHPSKPMDEK